MANFILNETFEDTEDFKLVFSDDSEEEYSEEEEQYNDEMFICGDSDDEDGEQDASFYRSVNIKNEQVNFHMQIRNPEEVLNEIKGDEFYREDDMPELFDPENRDEIEFDSFEESSTKSQAFKKSLLRFENVDNPFFYAVVYGLIHCKNNGKNVFLENAEQTLGGELFIEFKKIEGSTMINHSIFGYFEQCRLINELLFM